MPSAKIVTRFLAKRTELFQLSRCPAASSRQKPLVSQQGKEKPPYDVFHLPGIHGESCSFSESTRSFFSSQRIRNRRQRTLNYLHMTRRMSAFKKTRNPDWPCLLRASHIRGDLLPVDRVVCSALLITRINKLLTALLPVSRQKIRQSRRAIFLSLHRVRSGLQLKTDETCQSRAINWACPEGN